MHFYYSMDEWELYDLQKDPNEMQNIYSQASPGLIESLKKELQEIRKEYKDDGSIEQMKRMTDTVISRVYNEQWTNDTISNSTGSIIINNLQETDWYYLYVKDTEGCLGYDSIYVVVGVKPYEAITPNNDGFNDTWTPLDIQSYENALVQVFNRWGGLVFESKGGSNYQAWNGTNSGEELAVGTYYYIIDLNNGDEPQTGPITIIR